MSDNILTDLMEEVLILRVERRTLLDRLDKLEVVAKAAKSVSDRSTIQEQTIFYMKLYAALAALENTK